MGKRKNKNLRSDRWEVPMEFSGEVSSWVQLPKNCIRWGMMQAVQTYYWWISQPKVTVSVCRTSPWPTYFCTALKQGFYLFYSCWKNSVLVFVCCNRAGETAAAAVSGVWLSKGGQRRKLLGIRIGTGSPLSKNRKAVLQGGGKVSKLFCARTVAWGYLNLSWRFSLFVLCNLTVGMLGWSGERRKAFILWNFVWWHGFSHWFCYAFSFVLVCSDSWLWLSCDLQLEFFFYLLCRGFSRITAVWVPGKEYRELVG